MFLQRAISRKPNGVKLDEELKFRDSQGNNLLHYTDLKFHDQFWKEYATEDINEIGKELIQQTNHEGNTPIMKFLEKLADAPVPRFEIIPKLLDAGIIKENSFNEDHVE